MGRRLETRGGRRWDGRTGRKPLRKERFGRKERSAEGGDGGAGVRDGGKDHSGGRKKGKSCRVDGEKSTLEEEDRRDGGGSDGGRRRSDDAGSHGGNDEWK